MDIDLWNQDKFEQTDLSLLREVSTDWTLNKMPKNVRNISDEVYPGIHVGDKILWI
jgi:hypothetical protein